MNGNDSLEGELRHFLTAWLARPGAGQGQQNLADPAGGRAGHEAGKEDTVDTGARRA